VLISLPLALLLNSVRRLRTLLRSVYFLPYVTSGIAVYFAWQYVLQPDGAINTLLGSVGLGSLQQPQGFLGNPDTALPTLIVITVWSGVPVSMLLYLAGLQAVDPTLIEAAQIDGAGPWRIARSVLWPLLRPITAIIVLLAVRDSLQGFQTFLIMTNGGPGNHTNVLGLETYRLAFLKLLAPTLGLSSALGWLLFLAAVALAAVNVRVLRRVT
jgi:ABC-type sugar transport system permease subunit